VKDWYPAKLKVPQRGEIGTINSVLDQFSEETAFHYAEFGIYEGSTALTVLKNRPKATVSLFDFDAALKAAHPRLAAYEDRITYYGNSQRHLDSYNWPLMKLIEGGATDLFDYAFLDGAHTVAVDALTFFLCDRLLKVGGFMDFDDYHWRLRGSSLDPAHVPEIGEQYTDAQIDAKQVQMIVDHLVKPDRRYREVLKNKVFQKVS